jgi:hypothetical protein
VADFAPQRGGQPIRSVITVAELLGRRHVPAGVPNGRIPAVRTAVSVSALLRREGLTHRPGRPLGPRAERMYTGLSSASTGRKMTHAAGGLLAVGVLAGAAGLFGNTVPGPTNSSALDGGYPGQNGLIDSGALPPGLPLLDSEGGRPGDGTTPAAFNPLLLRGLAGGALPGTGGPVALSPAAAAGGVPATGRASTPDSASSAPGSSSGSAVGDVLSNTASTAGSAAQGGVDTVTGAVGQTGTTLGETARSVGNSLPVAGPLVSDLGSTVSRTTRDLSDTLDSTADGLLGGSSFTRSHSSPAANVSSSSSRSGSGGGSALSSLTNPITHQDAISKTVRSGTGQAGNLLGDSGGSSSGRHSANRLSSSSYGSDSYSPDSYGADSYGADSVFGSSRYSGDSDNSDGSSLGGRQRRYSNDSDRHSGSGNSYSGGHGGGGQDHSGRSGSGSGVFGGL